ncbi:MAG TPA: hypothetical protein VFC34_04900, partial [Puia sp.]|nr:hypothetical protein [Puia sp.]
MGVDLVAALYRGLLSYSDILKWKGDSSWAAIYAEKAKLYQDHIDQYWWDDVSSLYNTYYTNDNKFGHSEGESFLLWFDALKNNERKQKTIMHLNAVKWNIETLSYLPLLMYRNGYADKAYDYILHLSDPSTKRREYPEVSFGVIEGIVQGLMGIDADARLNRISTIYRGKSASTAQIRNLPVLGVHAAVRHKGNKNSQLYNGGKKTITWRPEFMGNFSSIWVDGKTIKA